MTVATTQISEVWTGDASSVTFPIPFPFLDRAHLIVWKETAGGVQTAVTIQSATGEGEPSGGSITLTEPVGVGYTLHVRRNTPKTQETDYVPHDPFPADSHERALDKLTMIVQELIASGAVDIDVETLRGLIGDSSTIVWTLSPDGTKTIASVVPGAGDTYKVKLDENDAAPGYLDEKMADATDVQFTPKSGALDSIVYQLTGIGARLLPVKTDFEWAGWADGYLYGGRGISPGYAWIGEVGSQEHVRVWRANDAGAHMYQTSDNWATTVHDTSAVALLIGTRPPCLKYATVYGVASWILTSNTTGDWWYAQDIAANYNADGSLKVAAWVHSTNVAPHQIADISESSGVFCLIGNHGYITKTTDLTAFLDVYSGSGVIGGIDNDRTGKLIAVGRDTGAIIMSLDNGDTWTLPAVYIRDDEEGEYVTPSIERMAAGCVAFGNGIWLITSSSGTEYFWSEDGIHWTAGQNPMGTFYGVASDGVRFYATNPYKVGTGAQQVVYRLLVSEIPAHRHFVAEEGVTLAKDVWIPSIPSAGILGTDENARVVGRTVTVSTEEPTGTPSENDSVWYVVEA